MRRLLVLHIILVSLLACSKPEANGKAPSNAPVATNLEKLEPISIDTLKILSLPEALDLYPNPVSEEEFQMDGGLGEFRIELYNYVTPAAYEAQAIMIQEVTWKYQAEKLVTVWYTDRSGEWTYLHHTIWDEGSEF